MNLVKFLIIPKKVKKKLDWKKNEKIKTQNFLIMINGIQSNQLYGSYCTLSIKCNLVGSAEIVI